MFINKATNEAAYLVSHDTSVVYSASPDKSEPHTTVPSFDFFDAHREATREEIEAGAAKTTKRLAKTE